MKRLHLAHTPTPLWQPKRLAEELDLDLWIKRDDMTGGPEAGNKIRKLEYLLCDALARGADTLVTCGGVQSNHARATAVVGASLGLSSVLFLRATEPVAPTATPEGNLLLDRLVGADLRFITPAQYRGRGALMEEAASALRGAGRSPYVIPEGGSNGLGALGYVRAMAEVRQQLDMGLGGRHRFDVVVHACGSGGTAAGVALGAARYDVADEVRAVAVCDDTATFARVISRIIGEARELDRTLDASARLLVDDQFKGPGYGLASPEQRGVLVHVARKSGLLLDPTYSGKAFFGLMALAREGKLAGRRVLFVHTGGLPGLLASGRDLVGALDA